MCPGMVAGAEKAVPKAFTAALNNMWALDWTPGRPEGWHLRLLNPA